ncbi:MAG: hypothetical protein Q8N63_06380 [Nanoarchaeota archaeon]|nr:hypothetical protein [Nanoarchaeota archaeon]
MEYASEKNRAGWDDIYRDNFEILNIIINDNLNGKHNKELINKLFPIMLEALEKAENRMKEIEGEDKLKQEWYDKAERIKNYSNQAENLNKKVITINMIDQFLRSTY